MASCIGTKTHGEFGKSPPPSPFPFKNGRNRFIIHARTYCKAQLITGAELRAILIPTGQRGVQVYGPTRMRSIIFVRPGSLNILP